MSKFFRVLTGELYKIFRYPLTYLAIALLVAALIFSCFSFNSQNEKISQLNLAGQTKDEVYTSFMPLQEIADQQLNNAKDKLDTINNRSESALNDIKALIGENSTYNDEGGALWYYKNRFLPDLGAGNTTNLNSSREKIIQKLSSAKEKLDASIKTNNIHILITENNYKKFIKDLDNCVKIFNADTSDKNELNTYTEISNKISTNDLLEKLKNYTIKDLTQIEIPQQSIDELVALYTKAQSIQNDILANAHSQKDNASISVQDYKNNLLSYLYVSQHYISLVDSTILYENVQNLSDVAVRKYKGYSDLTIYQLRENITKNKYLLENGETQLLYTTPFKAGILSSDDNVFDLLYYGNNICSIILLLFAIIMITRQIAGEFGDGSFKVLLTHSFKRHKVLSAKILSTLLVCLLFMLISTLILFTVGAITYGVESTTILAIFNGASAFKISSIALFAIYFGLLVIKLLFFILIAATISIIFRNKWISGSISLVLLVLTITAPLFLNNSVVFAYTPLAGIDMFKFFGNGFIIGNENAFVTILESSMYLNSNFYISLVSTSITALICLILSYSLLQSRELK